FFQWLSQGSLFRYLHSSVPFYSPSSSISGVSTPPQIGEGVPAEGERSSLFSSLHPSSSFHPYLHFLYLPERPNSFLLFLYSTARDHVCVKTCNLLIFYYGIVPFFFFLLLVFLFLPPSH
ncbi:glycosylphosphatidylinositol anchor attachment protein 1, partial [Cystoisospora suis]